MGRTLVTATVTWLIAVGAAIAAVAVQGGRHRLALALFVLAVVLGAVVVPLVVLGRVKVRLRRHAANQVDTPLARLEYVPSVTTGAPLLRWRGSRYWVTGRSWPDETPDDTQKAEVVGAGADAAAGANADRPGSISG
jgi:hypothetical protein